VATAIYGYATLYRLRLVDELAGPSGNMGFGWGKQRNKNEPIINLKPYVVNVK